MFSNENKVITYTYRRGREQALNRIAYAKGEEDYDAYVKRMLAIKVEYNEKKLAHTELEGNEEVGAFPFFTSSYLPCKNQWLLLYGWFHVCCLTTVCSTFYSYAERTAAHSDGARVDIATLLAATRAVCSFSLMMARLTRNLEKLFFDANKP